MSEEHSGSSGSPVFLTRVPTGGSGNAYDTRGSGLPDELVEQSARRVEVVAWVAAVVWLLIILTNVVLLPVFRGSDFPGIEGWLFPNGLLAGAGCGAGIALGLIAHRLRHRPRVVTDAGLAFEVFTCAVISVISFWDPEPHAARISWNTVVILLYPAIVPAAPRRILLASLAAAGMDALGFGIARMRGLAGDWPPEFVLWMLFPSYLCAVLALIPAGVILRLGRAAHSARVLGSYQLLRQLGDGGMGVVHEARHRLIARPAAVKLIRPDLLWDEPTRIQMAARFYREAESVAQLRSPHTIQLYDFGQAVDGTLYYAMELLDGLDLERLVLLHGPQPAGRVRSILRQACASLAEAHDHGLVHRDIKPSNLFVCRVGLISDFVKVLDFGLVRREAGIGIATAPPQQTLTRAADQGPPGTPAFMCPEAVLGLVVGSRGDLYSLACVGYWLLTGKPVFEGDTSMVVMYRHAYDEPQPVSQRGPLVPAELEQLLLTALSKDPERRPASAEEFARLLDHLPVDSDWTEAHARRWWDTHYPVTRGNGT